MCKVWLKVGFKPALHTSWVECSVCFF